MDSHGDDEEDERQKQKITELHIQQLKTMQKRLEEFEREINLQTKCRKCQQTLRLVAKNGPQVCEECEREKDALNAHPERDDKSQNNGSRESRSSRQESQAEEREPNEGLGTWRSRPKLKEDEKMILHPITKENHR